MIGQVEETQIDPKTKIKIGAISYELFNFSKNSARNLSMF